MDSFYSMTVSFTGHPNFGQRIGYRKGGFLGPNGFKMPMYVQRANILERAALNMDADGLYGANGDGDILIVGSGLGFLNQELMDRQPSANIWGIDNGAYLAGPRLGDMDPRYVLKWMNFDFVNIPDIRNRTNALAGVRRWRAVITEDVISSFTDAEIPAFLDQCDQATTAQGFVIHVVTASRPDPLGGIDITGDSALNWKRIEDWRATRTTHRWIHPTRNLDI